MALFRRRISAAGLTVIYNGQPHQMTEVQFVNPGKGSSFYRTTMKNLRTGRVVDLTSSERVAGRLPGLHPRDAVPLQRRHRLQFHEPGNDDQVSAPADVLGTAANSWSKAMSTSS